MMYFEDSKKLYKAIEIAKFEGSASDRIVVDFTYYELDGELNKSRSRYYTKIFSTVLDKYEYMQTLPDDYWLKNLPIGEASETDTSEDATKLNFDIFEAHLYIKGFGSNKTMIGYNITLNLDKDEFMQEARTLKKDFEEYEKKRNYIENSDIDEDLFL